MDNKIHQALARASIRILRPLVRILLRNGVAYGTFSDITKKIYTDVAFDEFSLDGKKQTVSRVAILTGLTRKEVKRLHEMDSPESAGEEKHYNRAIRVISGWINDPLYCSKDHVPLPLPIDGTEASFTNLVKSYSGDVPVQAILNELIAANSVKQQNDMVYLIRHAYVPTGDSVENINIMGTDVEELIATIDHNLTHQGHELRFQRKVSNHSISAETLKSFKQMSAREAQIFLERLDAWLTEHEIQDNAAAEKPVKVCLGIYYYEEPSSE